MTGETFAEAVGAAVDPFMDRFFADMGFIEKADGMSRAAAEKFLRSKSSARLTRLADEVAAGEYVFWDDVIDGGAQ